MNKLLLVISVTLQVICCYAFNIQPRILNGQQIRPKQFPFYVYLETGGFEDDTIRACGGSLISDRWILTAAHCLIHKKEITAYMGYIREDAFVQDMFVSPADQFIYESFDYEKFTYDVGLIRLPQAVKTSAQIHPARLPTDCSHQLFESELVIAAGSGRNGFDNEVEHITLNYANLTIHNLEECRAIVKSSADETSFVCAHPTTHTTICSGDSGGPLVRHSDTALVGVASYVKHLMFPDQVFYLQIFSSVPFYFDWIADLTGLKLPTC